MNDGNLGLLHCGDVERLQPHFRLPLDTLRPLTITTGSTLDGVYYPPHRVYDQVNIKRDFMLTPIPFRFWPTVVRVRVRLRHVPGTIAAVSECLPKLDVSILHGHSTRSGYRYCTWNMIVAVPEEVDDDDFNSGDTIYRPTAKWVTTIKRALDLKQATL